QLDGNGTLVGIDGSPAFGIHFSLTPFIGTDDAKLSGVAVTPGTVIYGVGVPVPAGDTHRVVVTDRNFCYVYIFDAGLNFIRRIPSMVPDDDPAAAQFSAGQGGCVQPSTDQNGATLLSPLGYFGSAAGAAMDGQGHIFVTDYENSRVQILDSEGNPLGSFGTPPDPATISPDNPPPPGTLQSPWAVTVDHLGRIGVADSDNNRIAFFTADFGTAPPTVTFDFQLNASGTLNGTPFGLAEQASADTDPAGRLVVADNAQQRIQRFQLPDLAIANVSIDGSGTTGTFSVAVPAQKASPVFAVTTSVTGVNASVLSGPSALPPADTLAQIDIPPGQLVGYNFAYDTTGHTGPVSFLFDAVGNNGNTHADQTSAVPTTRCADCSTTPLVLNAATLLPAAQSGGWYNQPLVVRLTATSTTALGAIAYQFVTGPAVATYGGGIHSTAVSGLSASIDVQYSQAGFSTIQYWAINADGSVEQPRNSLNLSLDTRPPTASFTFPIPDGYDVGGNPWF